MTADSTPPTHQRPSSGLPAVLRSSRIVGIGVFLAGCMVAALFAFLIYPHQGLVEANLDVNGFGALARFIVKGDGFAQSCGPTLRRAPLYPYLVAGLLRVFQHNPDPNLPARLFYRPILAAQCLVVGFNCLAVWTLGRKLFGARAGLLAALLCLVMPMVMRYVGSVEVETLMSLLITLMALTGVHLYRRPTVGNCIAFAIICALATLTKSIVLAYPPLFLIMLWFRRRQQSANADNATQTPQSVPVRATATPALSIGHASAWVLSVFCLCLLPWTIRNYRVSSGQFKNISSNGPAEFLRGYLNAQPKFFLLRQDFGGADPTRLSWEQEASGYEVALLHPHGLDFAMMERGHAPDPTLLPLTCIQYELRKEAVESAEMKRRLLHEPGRFVLKFGVQLATFWYVVETRTKSLLVGTLALLTLAFAGFGWIRARVHHPEAVVIVFTVLYFNIIYAVFLAFARYSMPLYPILLVLAAYGVLQITVRRNPDGKI